MSSVVNGFAPAPPPPPSEKYFRGTFDSIKLSDTFDWTDGGNAAAAAAVVVPVPYVDAAEMEDDDADGVGGTPLFAVGVKSDIAVDDDDLIESSTDAAEDEMDLYMESSLDDMLSPVLAHVRSFDIDFLCVGCFDIEDAIS